MPTKPDINVDLWPLHAWSEEDLSELIRTLESYGVVTGQRSSGLRGIDTQTVLTFVSATIAAGFLTELGADIYRGARRKVFDILARKNANAIEISPDFRGYVAISYPDRARNIEKMYLAFCYRNETELGKMLLEMNKLKILAESAADKSVSPFDRGPGEYRVHAEGGRGHPNWDVAVDWIPFDKKANAPLDRVQTIIDFEKPISDLKHINWHS